jgi:NADH-quinone oxidoreductase subunit M
VLISAFDYAWYVGAVAVTGIVLSAVYVLWAYQRMMTGPEVPEGDTRDLNRRELLVVTPLMVGLVLFGFYPAPLLEVSNPTVYALLDGTGVPDDGPDVPIGSAGGHEESED